MLNLAAALAPVVCLLVMLVAIDSFKLVATRVIGQALAAGAVAGVAALLFNGLLIDALGLPIAIVTRAAAPAAEELLKLAFVVYAVRGRRVGFPVDAAILGFAVGTGFRARRERVLPGHAAFDQSRALARARFRCGRPSRRHDGHRRHCVAGARVPAPGTATVGIRAGTPRGHRDSRAVQPVRAAAGRRDARAHRDPAAAGAVHVRTERARDAGMGERGPRPRRRATRSRAVRRVRADPPWYVTCRNCARAFRAPSWPTCSASCGSSWSSASAPRGC